MIVATFGSAWPGRGPDDAGGGEQRDEEEKGQAIPHAWFDPPGSAGLSRTPGKGRHGGDVGDGGEPGIARRVESMYRAAWFPVIGWLAACGGGGGGTADAPGSPPGEDALLEACAILSACVDASVGLCVDDWGPRLTASRVSCVRAATAADCAAATSCLGFAVSMDPTCTPGCVGDTVVRCDGAVKSEVDCASYIDSTGPSCISSPRLDCGGGTCAVDGEESCAGSVYTRCDSGVTEVFDCARFGLECTLGAICHGPVVGTCTPGDPSSCDGDGLVECIGTERRRLDCRALIPGTTCVTPASGARCGYGSACDSGTDTCAGAILDACVLGARRMIDCTAIGATTCMAGSASARCTP
jgi:hypothetical protein